MIYDIVVITILVNIIITRKVDRYFHDKIKIFLFFILII